MTHHQNYTGKQQPDRKEAEEPDEVPPAADIVIVETHAERPPNGRKAVLSNFSPFDYLLHAAGHHPLPRGEPREDFHAVTMERPGLN